MRYFLYTCYWSSILRQSRNVALQSPHARWSRWKEAKRGHKQCSFEKSKRKEAERGITHMEILESIVNTWNEDCCFVFRRVKWHNIHKEARRAWLQMLIQTCLYMRMHGTIWKSLVTLQVLLLSRYTYFVWFTCLGKPAQDLYVPSCQVQTKILFTLFHSLSIVIFIVGSFAINQLFYYLWGPNKFKQL